MSARAPIYATLAACLWAVPAAATTEMPMPPLPANCEEPDGTMYLNAVVLGGGLISAIVETPQEAMDGYPARVVLLSCRSLREVVARVPDAGPDRYELMDRIEEMRAEDKVYTFDDVEAEFTARGFETWQDKISRSACICDERKRDFMVILDGTGTE